MTKLISWNVNGIRAVAKKGFFQWASKESPDALCLQETKASEGQAPVEIRNLPGYDTHWNLGERKGYSGVATFLKEGSKAKLSACGFGLGREFDAEGRILISEHPGFLLLNIYFPNGQRDEERLRYKLAFYDATLAYCEARRKEGRELVICGDFNTAHNEIDLARPKDNENVSGFLRIERDWMDKMESMGYCDSFRMLHPEVAEAYTWWSVRTAARERNVGWRLDYFYISSGLKDKVKRAEIMSDVQGSDHCPVLLELA
jgi:exodeoxyribonuclease III